MGRAGARARSSWFLFLAWLALAIVFAGFFKTFTLPSLLGSFHAPTVVYLHGALLLLWVLLFVAQSTLVQAGQVKRHRALGVFGLFLMPCVVISTAAVSVFAMHRDLAAGLGQIAVSSLVGGFTSPLLFAILVVAAVAYRRKPEFHKRLMLLALLAILWPAFFRFRHYFPSVPRPDIWFAFVLPDSLIVLAMLHDKLRLGRAHPVYWIAGLGLILENGIEVLLFDSPGWRLVASWLAAFFPTN